MIEDAYQHVFNTGHTVVGAMTRTAIVAGVDHAWFCLDPECAAHAVDDYPDEDMSTNPLDDVEGSP